MAEQQFKEIDRSLYDFKDDESEGFYRMQEGLTADIVERISEEKHDPESKKIYTIISVIGGVITAVCAGMLWHF